MVLNAVTLTHPVPLPPKGKYTCFHVCDSVRVQAILQQAWWQEPEAAGHMASTVRKEAERDEYWCSAPSYSAGLQPLQDGADTFRVALLASVETYWKQTQRAAASVSSRGPHQE